VPAQEVAVLARCRAPNITEYYASVLQPGTTQLLIVMELMAASAADLVRTPCLQVLSVAQLCKRYQLRLGLSQKCLCMGTRGL
jgi:hypothetical protein